MNKSFYYLKKLTASEMGKNKANVGKYIRLPNDLDYKSFFQTSCHDNKGVQEIIFSAYNINKKQEERNLRFAYYKNSNGEKRIPDLAVLFSENDVEEGDVVQLESRISGSSAKFFIRFFKNSDIITNSGGIFYCVDWDKEGDGDIYNLSTYLNNNSIKGGDTDVITALRTKPFLLLAGISGTGKSRKVLELAFLTCKRDGMHDVDITTPGNYLLIPVKPNWHDSTELLGYYSSITGKYVLTDFIRFIWKAWMNRDVPYFLCLDEMNLAPVEQYFAEYLSILETRKRVFNNQKQIFEIHSGELLSKKQFEGIDPYAKINNENDTDDGIREKEVPLYNGEDIKIINYLKENGLRLPENLFVIGTVNMDDTTHQFSRKVIDRAFTIEMNGSDLSKMFAERDTLSYLDSPMTIEEIKPQYVKAQEVLNYYQKDAETIKSYVPELLERINDDGIFKDTPFRVSYRVQNELVLYYAAIRPQGNLDEEIIKSYLNEAFMAILLEKILPRVEGDEKAMKCDEKGDSAILLNIQRYMEGLINADSEPTPLYNTLKAKLKEMNERVKNSYFTSFFS